MLRITNLIVKDEVQLPFSLTVSRSFSLDLSAGNAATRVGSLRPKGEVGRNGDSVGTHGESRRETGDQGLVVALVLVESIVAAAIAVAVVSAAAFPATSSSAFGGAVAHRLIISPGGLGAMVAALVGLHAAADGLGRHARADLDVGLLNAETSGNWPSAAAAEGSGEHPLAVGLGKLVDRDDANTRLVVAAVSRAEAHTPSGLCRIYVSAVESRCATSPVGEKLLTRS